MRAAPVAVVHGGREKRGFTDPKSHEASRDRSREERHVVHYPLNSIELHISCYHHRTLGVSDILACRLIQAYLNGTDPVLTRNIPFAALHFDHPPTRGTWDRLPPLWQDLQVLNKLLALHPGDEIEVRIDSRPNDSKDLQTVYHWLGKQCQHLGRGPSRQGDEFLLDVLQRHHLETSHPEMEDWLSYWPMGFLEKSHPVWPHKPDRYDWSLFRHSGHRLCKEEQEHLRKYHYARRLQHQYDLFSHTWLQQASRMRLSRRPGTRVGPARRPPPRTDVFAMTNMNNMGWPYMFCHMPRFAQDFRSYCVAAFPLTSAARQTRRSSSEPPPGLWMQGYLRRSYNEECSHAYPGQGIYFRKVPFSELMRRYRRRSLSRRNVKDMFHVPSKEGGCLPDANHHGRWILPKVKLSNYFSNDFDTSTSASDSDSDSDSHWECPFCNRDDHTEKNCKAPRSSHCKCGNRPKHLAKNCFIQCSRQCGNPYPPGHPNKHPNAMLCKYRCCMCGIRGHSGKACRYKTCRCGNDHLGQDHGWHPTCKIKGCDRFLCGMHCRECGSTHKPFVGWRCKKCLSNGRPVGSRADGDEDEGLNARERRNRKRWEKRKGRERPKEEEVVGMGMKTGSLSKGGNLAPSTGDDD